MDRSASIFLVGMMGAGKTTIGRALARQLHRSFVDSDREIVDRTGVTIPVIFDVEGEAGFRARERALLEELTQRESIILGTGGGAVLLPENRAILRSRGTVVYLHASLESLWRRLRDDRHRPLLQTAEPRKTLERLIAERDPLYREVAHLVVETGEQSVPRLIANLLSALPDCAKTRANS